MDASFEKSLEKGDSARDLEFLYFQVTDLWKKLCEEHSTLFELTCDEYSYLLTNNLDELEKTVQDKQIAIDHIGALEQLRNDVIQEINKTTGSEISSVGELLETMNLFEKKNNHKHLFRFNEILIDIIEKIQEQNKKNQLFINKALLSLREIRESALGKKSYPTYTSSGRTSHTASISK